MVGLFTQPVNMEDFDRFGVEKFDLKRLCVGLLFRIFFLDWIDAGRISAV